MYNPTMKRPLNFFTTVLAVGQNLIGTDILQGITDRNRDLENDIISSSLGAEVSV